MMWNDETPRARESDSGEIIWGIVILAITGGITLGTYVYAAQGGTYWVTWGGLIFGAWKVLRGWVKASLGWRVLGIIIVVAMVVAGLLVFRNSQSLGSFYNSVELGDCLDQDGLKVDCNGRERYQVQSVQLYGDEMRYPGTAKFEADGDSCAPSSRGYYFHPTRLSWDEGDRSLLCVEDVQLSPDDFFNSFQVGDCLNALGYEMGCGPTAAFEVMHVKSYPPTMIYPGDRQLDLDAESCPRLARSFFSPTRETWSEGDRSLVCVRQR